MRTIDPFFAPGLWGGAPMPPQSPTMTAGRLSSPQRRPAVIAPLLAHAPLASLTGSVLGPRFHAWYGRSRRRTICSVYLVRDDEAKGLPDFAEGIVIAARRGSAGLHALAVFALGDPEDRRAWVEEAISSGATEWHVHLLAEDEKERLALLQDLGGI